MTYGHIEEWLQPYYDGELTAKQAAHVEAHLAECAACQTELAALADLSALLQDVPPAAATLSDEQFAAQVALQLPRHPERSRTEKALITGWKLVPAALVAVWIFMEAAALLTSGILELLALTSGGDGLMTIFPQTLGPAANPVLSLGTVVALLQALELGLESVSAPLRSLTGLGEWAGLFTLLNLALPLVWVLLLWSWLASRWARERHRTSAAEGMTMPHNGELSGG